MSFVRELIKSAPPKVTVEIPEEMRGESIEVLVLPVERVDLEKDGIAGTDIQGNGMKLTAEEEAILLGRIREIETRNGWEPGYLDKLFGSLPDFHLEDETEDNE